MKNSLSKTAGTVALAIVLLSVYASTAFAQGIIVTNVSVSAQPKCLSFTGDLARGARGTHVQQLQNFLVAQGYLGADSRKATGFFGPLTQASVQAFQASRHIPETGRADLVTRAAIMIASCGASSYDIPNYVPLFRGLHGPAKVKVGEAASWTAIVNNEYSAHFTTSVNWSDGSISSAQTVHAQASHAQNFPHTYSRAGTYDIVFTVATPSGKKNTSTFLVTVVE